MGIFFEKQNNVFYSLWKDVFGRTDLEVAENDRTYAFKKVLLKNFVDVFLLFFSFKKASLEI